MMITTDKAGEIKHKFLTYFTPEELETLIQVLTEGVQRKFTGSLTSEQVDTLMLELKSINKLNSLFLEWFNQAADNEQEESEEVI